MNQGKITSSGCDFVQFCSNFDVQIEGKFAEFARMVFPPAERMRRALPGTEYLRNYPIVEVENPTAATASSAVPVASTSTQVDTDGPATTLYQIEQEADASDSDSATSEPPAAISQAPRLSAYEIEREANIARNNKLLQELGLDDVQLGSKAKPARARKPKEKDVAAATRRSSSLLGAEESASQENTEEVGDIVMDAGESATNPVEVQVTSETAVDPVGAQAAGDSESATSSGEANGTPAPIANTVSVTAVPGPSAGACSHVPIPDAPAWLQTAAEHLAGMSADARWSNIVASFIECKKSLGFLDGKINVHMLAPGKHRPKEVAAWVKNGRATDPVIKAPDTFGIQWWMWYAELQPESRKGIEGHLQRVPPENNKWT
ncbi:hypothetical protein EYR40_009540 [Pleurotus pulmonarius]|nr:hypothetical protein EYR38_009360 [Pleurotus pulmonarius]KAF4590943.1 hypothetical protein EYR40_009540 [Pleurotus pulmonarius]